MADLRADAGAEAHRLEVRRVIKRPPAEVFAAWTTPATLERWLAWRVTTDPRVGGAFHIDMHWDGKVYAHDGEYLEVDPPRRLKFTWVAHGSTSLVTIDFLEREGGTEVVLTHEGIADAASRDDYAGGWTDILETIGKGVQGDIPKVEVRRVITRSPMDVFKAWTDPACIAEWISPGATGVKARIEARAGGRLEVELTYQGKPWKLDAEILEVVPAKRLRFTWVTTDVPKETGSMVTVTFRDIGGQTELHLLHEGFPSEKLRADHDATGWQQIVNLFVEADGLSPASLRAAAERTRGAAKV